MTFLIGALILFALSCAFLFVGRKKPDEVDDLRGTKNLDGLTTLQKIFDDEAFDTFTDELPTVPKNFPTAFVAPDAEILVVDADEKILLDATNFLKATRVTVDTATSGMFCLEKLTRKHYDLIFLARTMPVLDGIRTLEISFSLEENLNKDTPTIALTTKFDSISRAALLAKGFTDCISKPLDANLLQEMLLDYLPIEKLRSSPVTDEKIADTHG